MKAAAFNAMLKRFGVTQKAFADALDISERNVRRYVRGDLEVPRVVVLAGLYKFGNNL